MYIHIQKYIHIYIHIYVLYTKVSSHAYQCGILKFLGNYFDNIISSGLFDTNFSVIRYSFLNVKGRLDFVKYSIFLICIKGSKFQG